AIVYCYFMNDLIGVFYIKIQLQFGIIVLEIEHIAKKHISFFHGLPNTYFLMYSFNFRIIILSAIYLFYFIVVNQYEFQGRQNRQQVFISMIYEIMQNYL